jgi:thioredoxin-like negative regulator of GroEL
MMKYLAVVEQAQKEYEDKVQLRRIDIYKSDRIACRLEYTRSPSLILLKDGKILKKFEDLTKITEIIKEMVEKYS